VVSTIPESHPSVFLLRRNIPEKQEWIRNIETALAILKNGKAEKIVLGRSTMLLFSTAPNPFTLLSQLKAIEPFAYHFYFQPEHNSAFIGASPERLYKRQGQTIESEAVAGTCSRGTTVEEDKQFGEALLRSQKENCEHRFVCNDIESILQNLCCHVEVSSGVRLLKQTRVQHLYSQIHGKLRERVLDMDLIKRLHPTPAVGGSPRNIALQVIEALEPFDRGWFAGPVGWIGPDSAEFAVGIRSAVVNNKMLRLFAGAGVVQGSVPQLEWDELETKIGVFMDALQL
jgi:menaquinone-specific isochorismate synthase